jgi:hypothetical protein
VVETEFHLLFECPSHYAARGDISDIIGSIAAIVTENSPPDDPTYVKTFAIALLLGGRRSVTRVGGAVYVALPHWAPAKRRSASAPLYIRVGDYLARIASRRTPIIKGLMKTHQVAVSAAKAAAHNAERTPAGAAASDAP